MSASPAASDVRRHVEVRDSMRAGSLRVQGNIQADTVTAQRITRADGSRTGVGVQIDGVDQEGGAKFTSFTFSGDATVTSPSEGTARITYPAPATPNIAAVLAEGNSAGAYDIDMAGGAVTGFTKMQTDPLRRDISIGDGASATGDYSIAIGRNSTASGEKTVALGTSANASAQYCIAFGAHAQATAVDAVAVGAFADASAIETVALGYNAQASAPGAVAFGYNAVASNIGAVAIGSNSEATGEGAVAMGGGADAIGGGAITGARATGDFSIAVGASAHASHEESICLGAWAVSSEPNELTIKAGTNEIRTKFDDTATTAGAVLGYLVVDINGTPYKISLQDVV